ncbi:ATP-binding protein [Megalodesulfovibrio paquesii]
MNAPLAAPPGLCPDAPCRERMAADTYSLRTRALPGPSRRLAKAAVALLAEAVTDRELLYNIDLALTEACANVVRHAYPDAHSTGDVEIILALRLGQHIDVEVADWGVGFPTWPVKVENARPDAEGGRGLFIMSRLASHFECRKGAHRNSVFMRMQVPAAHWLWPEADANGTAGAAPSGAPEASESSDASGASGASGAPGQSAPETPWTK